MGAPLPWLALAASVTVVNGLTLRYLARGEPSTASRLWSVAWLLWAASTAPLMFLGPSPQFSVLFLSVGLLWAASATQFLRGSYALAEAKVPRVWYGVAGASAAATIGLVLAGRGLLAMLPLACFQSIGLMAAGVVVLRKAAGRPGARFCGTAMLLLGLHVLDAPLVMRHPWLVPWGFVFALALEVFAALGMVVLHYEQARARLLVAERKLEQARRTEALGRVAGGVAHDFNNLLTVLSAHVELLRGEPSRSQGVDEAIAGATEVVERGTRLTRQLLAFGRRAQTQPAPLDVRSVVASTLDLLDRLLPKRVALDLQCEDGDYTAVLDRALLEQVILNLVTNARDAIDDEGKITVQLAPRPSPPAIVLRVVDDGVGMAPELLQRIFEPFFTTKDQDQGTGLGLASVEGAVTQLGGTITVQSRPGDGTRFEVVLPRG